MPHSNISDNSISYANITCVVVAPICITKIKDMYFGTIISGNSGTVILAPNNITSITGTVNISSKNSIASSAEFEVTDGLGNNPTTTRYFTNYAITLPSNDVILINDEGKTMRVGNFTSNTIQGLGSFNNGLGTLTVGATLYVNSYQGIGKYVSINPFPVTVNFY